MNGMGLHSNWNQQKSKLIQKFAELTENDFLFPEEMKDEMLLELQKKLGKSREEIKNILANL